MGWYIYIYIHSWCIWYIANNHGTERPLQLPEGNALDQFHRIPGDHWKEKHLVLLTNSAPAGASPNEKTIVDDSLNIAIVDICGY